MFPFLRHLRARALRGVALIGCAAGALVATTAAGAGPAVTESMPMTYAGTNTCTGEPFTGTGTMTFLLSENLSTSGTLQHHMNVRYDGLKAVTPTGKRYVVQDTFNDEFVFGAASEETFDITAHFIRVGEDGTFILGDDFYEYLRAHITANANGMITAFRVDTNDDPCQ